MPPIFDDTIPERTIEEYRPGEIAQILALSNGEFEKIGSIKNTKSVKHIMASQSLNFKYKARFNGIEIKAHAIKDKKEENLALASLESLRPLIPNIDLEKNYDLIAFSANCYTPNLANRNNQIISGLSGIELAKSFPCKLVDLNHSRGTIIGFISGYGFSTFGDNRLISEDEARDLANKGEVFNVVISGIIWKLADETIADQIEEFPETLSLSWELGYNSYAIAVGGNLLGDCEIISDPAQLEKLQGNLKTYGGSGVDKTGKPMHLLISSDSAIPLGVGVVKSPASYVKGLVIGKPEDNNIDNLNPSNAITINTNITIEKPENLTIQDVFEEKLEIAAQNEENLKIQTVKENITQNNIMVKLVKLEDINTENLKELVASENGAGTLQDFYSKALDEHATEWKAKLNAEKEAVAAATKKVDEATSVIAELTKKVEKLEAEAVAKAAEETFQARMNYLSDEYDLDEEVRASIVGDIKACSTDEEFEAFTKKFSVIAKAMKKGEKPDDKKNDKEPDDDEDDVEADDMDAKKSKKKEVKASVDILEAAKPVDPQIPNSQTVKKDIVKEYASILENSTKFKF